MFRVLSSFPYIVFILFLLGVPFLFPWKADFLRGGGSRCGVEGRGVRGMSASCRLGRVRAAVPFFSLPLLLFYGSVCRPASDSVVQAGTRTRTHTRAGTRRENE